MEYNFCFKCGNKLEKDHMFCPKCGQKIKDNEEPEVVEEEEEEIVTSEPEIEIGNDTYFEFLKYFENNELEEAKKVVEEKGAYDLAKLIEEPIYQNVLYNKETDRMAKFITFLGKIGINPGLYSTKNYNNILSTALYRKNKTVAKAFLESESNKIEKIFDLSTGGSRKPDDEDGEELYECLLKYVVDYNDVDFLKYYLDLVTKAREEELNSDDETINVDVDMSMLYEFNSVRTIYSDLEDLYSEDELFDEPVLTALTEAILFCSSEIVKTILEYPYFEINYNDNLIIPYIDWSSVEEADTKKQLLKDHDYKFSNYTRSAFKGNKVKKLGEKEEVTLDSLKREIKDYVSIVFPDDTMSQFKSMGLEVDSCMHSFNTIVNYCSFLIAVEKGKEKELSSIIRAVTDHKDSEFFKTEILYNSKLTTIDEIKNNTFELMGAVFNVAKYTSSVKSKEAIVDKFVEFLNNWLLFINENKNTESKVLNEIKNKLESVDLTVQEETEETVYDSADEMVEVDGEPLQIVGLGLSRFKQEYLNASPKYYSYVGVDIKNPNKTKLAEDIDISVSFYRDGMIVYTEDDNISIIQGDTVMHYGNLFRVDEIFDNYKVRIKDCHFVNNEDNIDYNSVISIDNLRFKVDRFEEETKVSCSIRNNTKLDLRACYVFVQFLKNKKIVGGVTLYEYDVAAFSEHDLVTTVEMAIECDEVVASCNPRL